MKNKYPYISVIIPAYNAEKCLEESVNSIINQLYEPCEIIIINDGSVDSTENICARLERMYKNIIMIKNFCFSVYYLEVLQKEKFNRAYYQTILGKQKNY